MEKQHKAIGVANSVFSSAIDGVESSKEDVEIAYKFATEFKEKLIEVGTNKRFVRMIEDKTLTFGPKRKGPNILINKFLHKEESFFQRIYKQAELHLGVHQPEVATGEAEKADKRVKDQAERFFKV